MALVLDTGPVLAALDADDPQHQACAELLRDRREPLVVVASTLVEIDYWVRKGLSLDVWKTFVEDIEGGAYRLEGLLPADVARAADLQVKYADLDLGFVDASVIAICERLQEDKVATLDHRHFGMVRLLDGSALTLLPMA